VGCVSSAYAFDSARRRGSPGNECTSIDSCADCRQTGHHTRPGGHDPDYHCTADACAEHAEAGDGQHAADYYEAHDDGCAPISSREASYC
jgi:hypothetical protein